jgi:type VII secretion integral membrane protein EccD
MSMESVPASSAPGTCRVCIHLDDAHADVVIPAAIPLGQLVPWLYDLAVSRTQPPTPAGDPSFPMAWYLHLPGQPPLDPALTAAEHGILDGTTLILTSTRPDSPSAPVVDPAAAVLCTQPPALSDWAPQWSRPVTRLAAALLAGVGGFIAVPDGPVLPGVLLAATAMGTVTCLTARVNRAGRTVLMTSAVVCLLAAVTALGGTLFAISWERIGVALAVSAIGLLTAAGRVAMLVTGLTAHVQHGLDSDRAATGMEATAGSAQQVLTALVTGASVSAALGAAVIATCSDGDGRTGWAGCAIVAISAAVLLQRSREQPDQARRTALICTGTFCAAVLLVAFRHQAGFLAPWLCVAALAAAIGAMWFGCGAARGPASPTIRRCVDAVGQLALASVIPLACWSFGLYGTARGMSLA